MSCRSLLVHRSLSCKFLSCEHSKPLFSPCKCALYFKHMRLRSRRLRILCCRTLSSRRCRAISVLQTGPRTFDDNQTSTARSPGLKLTQGRQQTLRSYHSSGHGLLRSSSPGLKSWTSGPGIFVRPRAIQHLFILGQGTQRRKIWTAGH